MAVFKYVTRGEQTAQGKQKAYFCAHPDDFGKYFEKITNEILNTLAKENNRNCALFYLEDANAERDDEFKFSFKEMNLIVMPVTTKLLTTKNPALDIEFKLAEEYGIPVLPLMMEAGLETVFNAKCGDIQFLDPNSRDVTAISYEEKLTKYLTSVLIGDELAEMIRQAFDAYIFLSYRKKDRQYAQELMRLIHKNEFCRDIAIWYDEFLTPGENFNKSIEDALKKSKLFALAVTPNLVNEENYIMKVEYPMARKADKLILPAELVETDKDALASNYPNIPDCVAANDEPILTAALENALEGIALRENDTDPEHNFFIGLAYLGGVDVEKDSERAIKLITSSAKAGLPKAMEKLVSIYRNGEIGTRDYEKAIEWQKRLVNCQKQIYLNDHDEDSAFEYLHALWYLGDYLSESKLIIDAEIIYNDLLSSSKEIYDRFRTAWTLHLLSVSYANIGDIKKGTDPVKAEEYYRNALNIAKNYVDVTDSPEALRNLALCYERLGDICLSSGLSEKMSLAEEYLHQCMRISETLAQQTGMLESKRDCAVSYLKLGDCCNSTGNYIDAKDYYTKSCKLSEELARETGLAEIKRVLATSYDRLGVLYQADGKICDAKEFYTKSYELNEELVRDIGTIGSKRDLALSCARFGYLYISLGGSDNLSKAEDYYIRFNQISEDIAYKTNTIEALRDLMISYNRLGDLRKERKNYEKAYDCYIKALSIAEDLAKRVNSPMIKRDLSISYNKIGEFYKLCEKNEDAKCYYLKALKLREIMARDNDTIESNRDLAACYANLGDVSGEPEEAKEYYLEALEILENISNQDETVAANDDLAVLYYKISFVSSTMKFTYLWSALTIWTQLAEQMPDTPKYAERRDMVKRMLGIK